MMHHPPMFYIANEKKEVVAQRKVTFLVFPPLHFPSSLFLHFFSCAHLTKIMNAHQE